MAMRADRRVGFSLIEIVVVMTIVTMLFGLGLPGLISAQRRLDGNNALNIITAVHNACVRNARQFGATGTVYGFTLDYASDATVGTSIAIKIVPWEKAPSGTYGFPSQSDAKGAVGGTIPWDVAATSITFVDQLVPAATIAIDGADIPGGSIQALHVAYEPGTGFIHAANAVSPVNMSAGQANMVALTRVPVRIVLWNKKQKRQAYVVSISAVGVLDVKNG